MTQCRLANGAIVDKQWFNARFLNRLLSFYWHRLRGIKNTVTCACSSNFPDRGREQTMKHTSPAILRQAQLNLPVNVHEGNVNKNRVEHFKKQNRNSGYAVSGLRLAISYEEEKKDCLFGRVCLLSHIHWIWALYPWRSAIRIL